ncbi:leucine aminopeptidase 3, chloroplastic-like [Lotus japonicus]|uniref:leucine aminopeptidase 3, chloroplastic-like n=1 Tax=Lotus japonicus TaxID=34305 RepID=UPI00258770C2|nr:leucine aminopeptidase 3, chloroplastic-like [Lotus japonicus]
MLNVNYGSRTNQIRVSCALLSPVLYKFSPSQAYQPHSFTNKAVHKSTSTTTETPNLSFVAKDLDVAKWKGDLLAVAVTENDVARNSDSPFENHILNSLDSKLNGLLAEASSEEDFTGKSGQSTVLRNAAGLGSKRLALVGLGKSASGSAPFKSLDRAVAAAAKSAQAAHVAVVLASSQGFSA